MPKGLILKSFLVAMLIFSAIAIRVVILQRFHFVAAEKHLAAGEHKLAIREYDTAMHLHVPRSPYTRRSAQRLWEMGQEFERQGRLRMAHMAYTALRSSVYATRGLYSPGRHWVEKCDERLAALRVAILFEEGKVSFHKLAEERDEHLQALRTDMSPSRLWSVMAELGFAGFIVSALYTILRGFDSHAGLRKRQALRGIFLSALSFALCVFSLYIA